MTKVLIADDHPIFRHGLKDVLHMQGNVEVIGEAETGWKALEMTRQQPWDVVVLDISMPGMSGMEVLRILKQEHPRLPVLILSTHPEDQYGLRTIKSGADGYLTKEKAPQELLRAITKLLQGGKYVSDVLAEELALHVRAGTDKLPHELLSDREYDIMRRIASGKSLLEIAHELALSPRTVSTYRTRLLEKMRMKTNTDLIRYALEKKLID